MWDWSLGQAGFREQVQVYGDAFWRQVGSVLLLASAVILVVLLFVALTLMLARRTEVSPEMRRSRPMEKFPGQMPPRSGRTRGDQTEQPRPRAA
jgi:hypothetical protein